MVVSLAVTYCGITPKLEARDVDALFEMCQDHFDYGTRLGLHLLQIWLLL